MSISKTFINQRDQIIFALLVSTRSTKLNSQKRLYQIFYSIVESIERVRKKSKQQLMFESQKRRAILKKNETKTKKQTTTIKKKTKQVTKRTKNVLQLTNNFKKLLLLSI